MIQQDTPQELLEEIQQLRGQFQGSSWLNQPFFTLGGEAVTLASVISFVAFILLALLASFLLLAAPAAAAPSWLGPVNLGAETPSTSSTGRVALGADGTAVAAWAQWVPSSGNWVLQVSRRRPGGGFSAAATVPQPLRRSSGGVRTPRCPSRPCHSS